MYMVLIADDEALECATLEMMIHNEMKSCIVKKCVYNGIDLLNAIEQERPDIAIIDINMPGMNGLEALELIRMKNPELKVIINTAYSDFSYIKCAMDLKVDDYILKPVKRTKLYEVLGKICNQLDKERQSNWDKKRLVQIEQDMLQIAKEYFVSSLFWGKIEKMSLELIKQNFHLDSFGGGIFLIKLPNTLEAKNVVTEIAQVLQNDFARSFDYLVKCFEYELYYYILPNTQKRNFENWITKSGPMIINKIEKNWNLRASIGVSSWKTDFCELPQAIEECRSEVRKYEKSGVYIYHAQDKTTRYFHIENQKRIQWLYQSKDFQNLIDEVGILIECAQIKNYRFEEIKYSIVFGIMQIIYETEDTDLKIAGMAVIQWNDLLETNELKTFKENLIDMLRMQEEKMLYMNISDNIYNALQYIQNYYMEDLSLDMVATSISITPFYLSRLLKQEIGIGFVNILTAVRMEKTIQLLKEKENSIRLISESVGYSGLNYFYKVFKKYYGITVGEMRELLLHWENAN